MLDFADDYIIEVLNTQWWKLAGKPEDENGDAIAAASIEVWKSGFSSRAVQKHIEEAYDVFVTKSTPLIFYHAWNPTLFGIKQYTVAVSLEQQDTPLEFFGHDDSGGVIGDEDPNTDTLASPQEGVVGLYMLAPRKPVLSFITYFVRRALLSASFDILDDLGLDGAHKPRSAALVAPPEFAPNGVPIVYGRKMEITLSGIDVAARLGGGRVLTPKPVLVHEEQDGIDAIVNRETGEETPLGATIFGRVRFE